MRLGPALQRALACLLVAATASASHSEPVDRALERAIERCQARLEATTELYEDHTSWENAWRVRSEHYEVVTTKSRYHAKRIAEGLESMLAHFKALLAPDFDPVEPFVIYVFPSVAAYNEFGARADEHSSFYGSFHNSADPARAVGALESRNWTEMNMWITHSALHQFIDRAFDRTPPLWISEGLASYFALFWNFDYGISEMGRINANEPMRRDGPARFPQQYVPLEELLAASLPDYMNRSHNRLIELGMFVSYLLLYREDTRTVVEDGVEVRAPFKSYLRTLLRGGDVRNSPVTPLLGERLAELELDFLKTQFGS